VRIEECIERIAGVKTLDRISPHPTMPGLWSLVFILYFFYICIQ
jgi:hypothetical protein